MELAVARTRCKNSLVWAIETLNDKVDQAQIEAIVDLIIQTMTGPWRYFHTTEHIFEVGGSGESIDAIEVLAALFHDIVYVQVDHGMNLNSSRYIAPFIFEENGKLIIEDAETLPHDLMFEIVMAVFGFAPGETLSPFKGQNEFLSAIVAVKTLEPLLPHSTIAGIVGCIEATIPFRAASPSGLRPSELLYQRMEKVNHQFNFGWDEAETISMVKRAVRVTNRDVVNFAFPNSADFLDNTWNLMPETNHELSNADSYTIQGYRRSLHKMEEFMNFLKPELVFQRFRDEPDAETYNMLISQTGKNLEVARLYLGVKLITIGILEAISYRLGRGIPLSALMGELPRPGTITPTLDQFLPNLLIAQQPQTELEAEVLELLIQGRNQESVYDLKNSPVATFIIKSIGFTSIEHLLKQAKAFFAGTISPTEFLRALNPDVLGPIIYSVEQVYVNRIEALHQLKQEARLNQINFH